MKIKTLLLTFAALALPVASFGATEIAKVNGRVITLEEFNRKFPLLQPLYTNKVATKQDVLDDLIKRELGVQEARRQNIEKDPEVQEEIQTVLYQALLKKSLAKEFDKITVSDKEAEAWYEKYPEVRTSHIFMQVTPGASKADEQKAYARIKEIQDKELKGGKSFAEVAQKFSEGVAAPMGGDIDFQGKDRLDPNYYQTALALKKPGNVSGIIRSQFGYHIIKLTAIRPWVDANKAAVKNQIFSERKTALFEKYMKDLRGRSQVSVNAGALK